MKPKIFLILIGAFVSLPFATMAEDGKNAPLIVGALLPLTGDFAFFGEQAKQGIEEAIKEINKDGQKVKVVFEDERCLPKDAVSAFNKLISIDKADFIIGPACTGSILSIAPLAKQANKNVLALLDTNKAIASAGKNIFAIGYSSEDEGTLIAEYLIKNNITKTSVVYEEDAWAVIIKDAFVAKYKSLNGEVLDEEGQVITNANSSPNYKPILTKITKKKPQALFVVPAYNGGHFLKQIRSLGIQTPVYGPDTFAVTEVLDIAKSAAEGVICANAIVKEESVAAQTLRDKLEKTYKKRPTSIFYSALGFDGLKILYKAATSGQEFSNAMADINYSEGVLEVKGFDKDGMSKLEAGLFRVNGGKFEGIQ